MLSHIVCAALNAGIITLINGFITKYSKEKLIDKI